MIVIFVPTGISFGIAKEPVKSFEENDFVVHGPEGYQRITARANSKKELEDLVEKLT